MKWLLRITFIRVLLVMGFILFFAFSPYDFRNTARKKRIVQVEQTSTPMEIAIVWPHADNGMFIQGAELAVEQINRDGGVTLSDPKGDLVKTPLVMHAFDEMQYPRIEKLAKRIAKNLNISAVIGHSEPDSALRASVTYRDNGMLFISPSVSDTRLTKYDFWTTVRTTPQDANISRAMVAYALRCGWQKAAVLYVRNTYGFTYNSLISADIGELNGRRVSDTNLTAGMELVFQDHYPENEGSFYPLISTLLSRKFDVIFLADSLVGSAKSRVLTLVYQLREMGVSQPIVGTEEIHSGKLWPALGQKANGIFAANLFDLHTLRSNPIAREFRVAFTRTYTNQPTMQACQAYEAVMLLAQAAERAHSKQPLRMATLFRSTPDWTGLQGEGAYDFSVDGGILGKTVVMDQMKDGVFIPPEVPVVFIVSTNSPEKNLKNRRN